MFFLNIHQIKFLRIKLCIFGKIHSNTLCFRYDKPNAITKPNTAPTIFANMLTNKTFCIFVDKDFVFFYNCIMYRYVKL